MEADKMILGKNAVYSTDPSETGLNNNVLAVGGSGSGKTTSILETRLLETLQSSLVISVSKKRLISHYEALFRARGYRTLVLDFTDPDNSQACYDPLSYLCSYHDISFLADAIVMSSPHKQGVRSDDPFWDSAASSLLSSLIGYTLIKQGENATFTDVLEVFDLLDFSTVGSIITTNYDAQFEQIAALDPHCFAVTCWGAFRKLPAKTAGCVVSTLHTALDPFTPELRKNIRNGVPIDIEQIASEKTVLWVITSAVNPSLHFFASNFFAQAIKQLFEFAESRQSGILPLPVHFLFDDFAVGASLYNFERDIAIMREKGLSATLLLQSEHQLRAMYGEDNAETIIENCDSYVFLGGTSLSTARNISERLDVPLSDVLNLPIGEAVIFRRGQRPMKTQRYNLYENEAYKNLMVHHQIDLTAHEK